MSKVKEFVGIDISKLTFDIAIACGKEGKYRHEKYENNIQGFMALKQLLKEESVCVMEASGPYYMPLAAYLYAAGVEVRIANPLGVKHFSRMRMTRAKTDKKDAALIAAFAQTENPPLWKPKSAQQIELQQLQTVLEGFIIRKVQLSNQHEALTATGKKKGLAITILEKEMEHIQDVIKQIEKKMETLAVKYYGELLLRLRSIPGIGNRTAMLMLMITDGFTRFDTAKELVGYIGICPRIYDSGTSVKGKQRICKMGMAKMRALLYMCAMTAKKSNAACAQMYERLKAKGKNGKLILVAIANKLVKQAFAVATSGSYYEPKIIA